nr:immunoglobulin heavy chain junction region [Mus musculus]
CARSLTGRFAYW